MPAASFPCDEPERLLALHSYDALDTPPNEAFEELVALAARICGTPVSLVSLVDRERQWFKARYGINLPETPRAHSFCAHALSPSSGMLLVPDARQDARFGDNPLVTGAEGIRFYAGIPLVTPGGHTIGTLCVLDRVPRTLTPDQTEALRVLGRQAMAQLELHRSLQETRHYCTRLANSQRIAALGDWDHDLVENRLLWSDEIYRILGLKREDFAPDSELFYRQVHPDDLAYTHRQKRAAAEGWQRVEFEHRLLRADGQVRYVHQIAERIFDDRGRPTHEVGTLQDITVKKELELQYLRAQRMESIGTLASGIAHDLNNVLAPIMISIELLQQDPANDPARAELLEVVRVSSRRGAELVRQVLLFGRGLDTPTSALALPPLIAELEKIVTQTFPRDLRIVKDLPPDLWSITGNPTQLQQVLLNLAVNARDAMPRGGVLTFQAANLTIAARPEANAGDYVRLTVTDTGVGIPPAVQAKIFDAFFTTKKIGEGSGLGLSTVQAIVKSHGGFITVESAVGQGTSFRVHLPACPSPAANLAASEPAAPPPRGRSELVLVVDDESSIRYITQQSLEAFGYRVLTAGDGAEGVAQYRQNFREIAVVLTDMMMPVMDGGAMISAMMALNPSVQIVITSGLSSTADTRRARSLGVKHFLPKPYTAQMLRQLIHDVLAT